LKIFGVKVLFQKLFFSKKKLFDQIFVWICFDMTHCGLYYKNMMSVNDNRLEWHQYCECTLGAYLTANWWL
jgi:hypothetical protein